MEGVGGKEFLPASRSPAARASAWSRAEKLPLHFLILRAPIFSFRRKRQFFCEAGRRFAAAGGGSAQVSLFGFVYQIWQNDFKIQSSDFR